MKNRIIKEGHNLLEENEFIGKAELESLRYKIAKGRIEKMYVYSPEDLAKEFKDQVNLLREFWKSGIDVIFVSEKVRVAVTEDLISFRSSYG
ncbi:hypothetical protein [Wolbachia endosymbiont (group E) of Neria commutata]|uniref:hypothetical protein n=1 Tax=Wolbachia endosymbiont (group E) of Neria commutata TaxID=3066149 RepID=UPI003133059F